MDEILNVTISGETYTHWKQTVDGIRENKHAIKFEGYGNYEWIMYTNDEALNAMAERYRFMIMKHDESFIGEVKELRDKVKPLEEKAHEANMLRMRVAELERENAHLRQKQNHRQGF